MTFPHPSRILHLKPREEKIQRTKLFPIYIQRDSPKMSKTSRSLWAIAAIGIRSRLPEQPSARENHRKSIGSGHQASRCCKEVLSWFCQGVTWTTWPLTRWWLVCGRSSLSRSFLQTSKFKCPFPRWEWVKKQKQGQARMTFPHPSRILHLKPREEKIQRTKLFPIYIQRDSPKMSKTSRSLWAIAAIGIRSRLPEQPSAREKS